MGDALRGLAQIPRWVWCGLAAVAVDALAVLLAVTVHNQGTEADPDCVHRCFTFVHVGGTPALLFVAAPGVIALLVLALLAVKVNRRTRRAESAAWALAMASCLLSLIGLLTSAGLVMVPAAVLTVCAVVTAP